MTLACISTFSRSCAHIHPQSNFNTLPHHLHPSALIIPAAYHSARADSNPSDEYTVTPSANATLHIASSSVEQIHDMDKQGQKGLLTISRGTALLLLATYVAYLIFQVRPDPFSPLTLLPRCSTSIATNFDVGDVWCGVFCVAWDNS